MTTATPGGAMPPSAKRPTATHARHRRTPGTARAALQTRALLRTNRTAHTTLRAADIALRSPGVPLRAMLYTPLRPSGMVR